MSHFSAEFHCAYARQHPSDLSEDAGGQTGTATHGTNAPASSHFSSQCGQGRPDAHVSRSACDEPSSSGCGGQYSVAPHSCSAATPEEPIVAQGLALLPVQPSNAVPAPADTITSLSEWERQRDDIMRAEGNLTRQVKAVCRRIASAQHPGDDEKSRSAAKRTADAIYKAVTSGIANREQQDTGFSINVLLGLRDQVHAGKLHIEKQLRKLAKSLPIYSFVLNTPGFGEIGLAQIVGKCGDLSNYSNPAKVWKRMGLGLVDGKRQQRISNDKELAIRHGYSPRRRSTMFVIGDSLVKCKGPYRDLYLQRKEFEVAKALAAGLTVKPAADIKKAEAETCMSQGHVHARAQRYMEKRLLRDLWCAWKQLHGTQAAIH